MDQRNFDHLKQAAKISIGLLALLFILSIVLYKLRMYFLDAPFVVFQIIKDDSLAIMVGRYGAIITQVFPWIGQKLGLPLSVILVLYSMSFNLFYLISSIFLYKLKAYHWVIILAFYQIGFATDAFFWTNNEIHQAICYLTISAGIWYHAQIEIRSNNWIFYILAATFLFIATLTHPLVIPVVVFIVVFMFLIKELSIYNKRHLGLVIFCLVVSLVKYYLSKSNWYDGGKLNQLSEVSISSWASFIDKPTSQAFLPELFFNHWAALVVLLISIVLLLQKKLYFILAWVILFSLSYIIVISMIVLEFKRFYTESQWMVIAIFIALPILYQLHNISQAMINKVVSFVLVLWFFNMIAPYHSFKNRYEWQTDVLDKMQKMGIDKLSLTDVNEKTIDTLMMSWGLPVESLILSVAEYNQPMTLIVNQPERVNENGSIFLSCFEEMSIQEMNRFYFPLDTSTVYRTMKHESF